MENSTFVVVMALASSTSTFLTSRFQTETSVRRILRYVAMDDASTQMAASGVSATLDSRSPLMEGDVTVSPFIGFNFEVVEGRYGAELFARSY